MLRSMNAWAFGSLRVAKVEVEDHARAVVAPWEDPVRVKIGP